MNTRYSLGGGALIAALLASSASLAEVTPRQVWDNWRGYMERNGYSVSATETADGGSLDVRGLRMTMRIPEGGGTVAITMEGMRFVDNGDGTVSIVMPDSSQIGVQALPDEGEMVRVTFTYSQPGMKMTVAGTPEDMKYEFSGDEVSLALSSLEIDGEPLDIVKFQMGLSGLSGDGRIRSGNLQIVEQNMIASGGMRYEFSASEPGGDGFFVLRGRNSRISLSGTVALPMDYDPNDMLAAFRNGFAVEGSMGFGAGASEFSFRDGEENASGSTSTGGSSFSFAMDAEKLAYTASLQELKAFLTGSEIPIPVSFSTGELAVEFAMPVSRSDMPGDFVTLFKLVDFAPDDMIWSMIDPTGALPHDPATLIIDMAGKANWLLDILDPANVAAFDGAEIPFALQNLTLNQLRVSAAGAELTGTGSFIFNNDDLETFDGLPAPDGSVDFRLTGANGLMDTLVSMGLMSEDDAMGARMMLGLFGRPGPGEDEVLSTIEIRSDGQILANGQRLQ